MGEEKSQLLPLNMIIRWPQFGRLELMVLWGYQIAVCLSMAFIVVSSPAEGIVFGLSLSLVYTVWALLVWPWGPRSFQSG